MALSSLGLLLPPDGDVNVEVAAAALAAAA
jgi:hypothetical protein